jgi:hypothetical protein
MQSIDVAYALHSWRWPIRIVLGALITLGMRPAWRGGKLPKVLVPFAIALVAAAAYGGNVFMSADRIFIAPKSVDMQPVDRNVVQMARLVVGIEINGDARA